MIFSRLFNTKWWSQAYLFSVVIVYGRHDLPSDARAFSLTSFGKKVCSMRLNKAFRLFNLSAQVLLG